MGRKKFFLSEKFYHNFVFVTKTQIQFCTSLLIGIQICDMIKINPNGSVHIMRLQIFEFRTTAINISLRMCVCSTNCLLFGFYLWVESILRFCWFIDSIQRQRWFGIFNDVDYVNLTKIHNMNVEKSMLSAGHINRPIKISTFAFVFLRIFKSFSELYSD